VIRTGKVGPGRPPPSRVAFQTQFVKQLTTLPRV
jgi:hypothetical protein